MAVIALVAVVVTMMLRAGGVPPSKVGAPYRSLALSMLVYVGATAFAGAWLSARAKSETKASFPCLALVAVVHVALMGWLIAVLP